MVINPTQITDHTRTLSQLQAFWIFCMVVAGKNSDYAARVISKLLAKCSDEQLPFGHFALLGEIGIRNALVAAKAGQYDRLTKGIMQSLRLNLETCSYEDLVSIFGVGPKTASFFLLHSRKGWEGAVLDTHILKYLADKGLSVPKSTPQDPAKYQELSKMFMNLSAAEFPKLSVAQRDLLVWSQYSGRAEMI